MQPVPVYHVFGLYLEGALERGPDAGVLMRLSTDDEEVADRLALHILFISLELTASVAPYKLRMSPVIEYGKARGRCFANCVKRVFSDTDRALCISPREQ